MNFTDKIRAETGIPEWLYIAKKEKWTDEQILNKVKETVKTYIEEDVNKTTEWDKENIEAVCMSIFDFYKNMI